MRGDVGVKQEESIDRALFAKIRKPKLLITNNSRYTCCRRLLLSYYP